jgi:hypothetical protein
VAKTKYLYATKMQLYMILASFVFVAAIMGFAYLEGGAQSPPPTALLLVVALMALISFLMWKSYKGELPMMRIEEH